MEVEKGMLQYLVRCTKEYKSSKVFEALDFECPGTTLSRDHENQRELTIYDGNLNLVFTTLLYLASFLRY